MKMTHILIGFLLYSIKVSVHAVPAVTGSPQIIAPDNLLSWPKDSQASTPSLTEPTSNRINDFHAEIRDCDVVLSTSGNYHMALKELWAVYLNDFANNLDIKTWYYTTSPPISEAQIADGVLTTEDYVEMGNIRAYCRPSVAVGPLSVINNLTAKGVVEGSSIPIIKNRGNVILVKKGNPKNIQTVWDLGKNNIAIATPNPDMEPGSFGNFSGTIFNIADNDPNPPANETAEALFDSIFNLGESEACSGSSGKCKWVTGERIMHREIPYLIKSGEADAAVIFYHLAYYFTQAFPNDFEIVPLGGTVENPDPATGNKIGVLHAVRINGNWSTKQLNAREELINVLQSTQFTGILSSHRIDRP